MKANKFGVAHVTGCQRNGKFMFFWRPPLALQKRKVFRWATLGPDVDVALARARELNCQLDQYRCLQSPTKPVLLDVEPMTVAYLFRRYEASPRFTRCVPRTHRDYSNMYRGLETHPIDGLGMFGEMKISAVTRKVAYALYESYLSVHGNGSAKKAIGACRVAFNYGTLRIDGVATNPFCELGLKGCPSRRQRWSTGQLDAFILKAEEMGYPSIGRCALLCMELVQRPGDVLSLRWSAYRSREDAWYIRQSKTGAEVLVPSTTRLHEALERARRQASQRAEGEIDNLFVCPTKTGKRWHRRNFTKAARRIARAAGLPDDLQIRDLRRTGATEAASAGATPLELMAVGGWTNQASIRPYLVQTLEQAKSVQAKRDSYRQKYGSGAT